MKNKRFCDFAKVAVKTFEFTWYEQCELIIKQFDSDMAIADNAYEWQNSVIEFIDDILSLEVGETRWLCAIRDDKQSKGVICRVK